MKYYLGEIFVTHKRTWFGWMPFAHKFSTTLIQADDLIEAQKKADEWAEHYVAKASMAKKLKYKAFATPSI